EVAPGLGALVSHGRVAEAFVVEVLGSEDDDDGAVARFAGIVRQAAPRGRRAGPCFLLAVCRERDGETLEAERWLEEALEADPSYAPALEELAWYASDRGDARRGVELLRRAGVEDDDDRLVSVVRAFAASARPAVARNAPCPCGSGRKYKACCGRNPVRPLAERAPWLYQKAAMYAQRPPFRSRLLDIALARVPAEGYEALRAALDDPLTIDLALVEDGMWNDFVADRAVLLPEDERHLAGAWSLIERSVFEVTEVRWGTGLT